MNIYWLKKLRKEAKKNVCAVVNQDLDSWAVTCDNYFKERHFLRIYVDDSWRCKQPTERLEWNTERYSYSSFDSVEKVKEALTKARRFYISTRLEALKKARIKQQKAVEADKVLKALNG